MNPHNRHSAVGGDHPTSMHCDHGSRTVPSQTEEALIDPVCGMRVTPQSKHHVSHAGNEYFFCSAGCAAKFSADPEKYLDPRPAPTAASERPDVDLHVPDASADSSGRAG